MSSIPDQAIEPDAAMFKLARETIMKRWIEQSIWNSSISIFMLRRNREGEAKTAEE
ncbi:ATPase domain, prokaryote [Metarhizium robertsii ARSEF 23]|uniref:ATPase domain, prokaryote n=1 Tax=Metarhizium robertsii (strain ARSEF 23 / ATCC MYA-3075) TaxID=655844 RepID=A0A0B2XIF3_METRA|nr:ATPase domain, prokaryote [Metarhizium robertsii ARSEF 23]KHO11704.1 ATPase domain, prokaryote [Metarhizium robertsii ARSEF 23]